MSTWIQENIIKNLTAFQLCILILGYMILPLVDVFNLLLTDSVTFDLYMVLFFAVYCLVVICLITVAAVVYRKDKEAKIETAKAVEFTPREKFTLKQAIALMQGVGGLKSDGEYVPLPVEPTEVVTREEFKELQRLVLKALELVQSG